MASLIRTQHRKFPSRISGNPRSRQCKAAWQSAVEWFPIWPALARSIQLFSSKSIHQSPTALSGFITVTTPRIPPRNRRIKTILMLEQCLILLVRRHGRLGCHVVAYGSSRKALDCVIAVVGVLVVGPAAPTETVRDDWYFRESLSAIRDWEQLLTRDAVAGGCQTPVLPVPTDGREVAWPNPIPALLVPARDRNQALVARLVEGKCSIWRVGSDGRRTPETFKGEEGLPAYKHPGGGGSDQWYHRYTREFDRLTTFQPTAAPFALHLDAPADFRRGINELSFTAERHQEAVDIGSFTFAPRTEAVARLRRLPFIAGWHAPLASSHRPIREAGC